MPIISANSDNIGSFRHGHSGGHDNSLRTSEYGAWAQMIQRCTNPNHKSYKNYGGRGITVCSQWLQFENFLADVGLKPSPELSLDRIHNDGNYEPGNVRWGTPVEQIRNQRLRKDHSPYGKGIYLLPNNKYQVQISIDRKTYNLGRYESLEEAKSVRAKVEANVYPIS